MNLIVGPYAHHRLQTNNPPASSMYDALNRIDDCIQLIQKTGNRGLTDSTDTLGLNLTRLVGSSVVVINERHNFSVIIQDQHKALTLTGCLIQDTFHNIFNPLTPGYLISLNRQLIATSDDLIETIYEQF